MRPPLPSRGAASSLRLSRSSTVRSPPAVAAWRALKNEGRASSEFGQADGATNRGGAAGPLRALGGGGRAGNGTDPSSAARTSALAAPAAALALPLAAVPHAPAPPPPPTAHAPMGVVDSAAILAPVTEDMEAMNANLRAVVGDRHPMLVAAAEQIFGAGGKRLRPALVFLVARATADMMGLSDINDKHRRLAEITEMIHTASLVHDDVLDDCDTRRGQTTVNSLYGTRVAVLAGDFLFAQSSWFLANLDNLEVIKLISQVIADFANGEIAQAAALFDTSTTLESYLDRSFSKTATLIAASLRSAAVFSGCDEATKDAMFEYGRHLGLAFQVVDDILDYTQTEAQLGKPPGQDLASGNMTAPAVFSLSDPSVGPELAALVEAEFPDEGDLERALSLVEAAGGLDAARALARTEADAALAALACLPSTSPSARALARMVEYVLDRIS